MNKKCICIGVTIFFIFSLVLQMDLTEGEEENIQKFPLYGIMYKEITIVSQRNCEVEYIFEFKNISKISYNALMTLEIPPLEDKENSEWSYLDRSVWNNIPNDNKVNLEGLIEPSDSLGFVVRTYFKNVITIENGKRTFYDKTCLLYTSPSPRDKRQSRMPSSA